MTQTAKPFWESKTFKMNVIAILATYLAPKLGIVIGPEDQVAILAVVNLVLRAVTNSPVTLTEKAV
jgi:hypothetical protein